MIIEGKVNPKEIVMKKLRNVNLLTNCNGTERGVDIINCIENSLSFDLKFDADSTVTKLDIELVEAGILKEAITNFEHCLKLDQNNTSALIGLGNSYLISNDFNKALSYFEQALKIKQNLPIALEGKTICLYELKKKDELNQIIEELNKDNDERNKDVIQYLIKGNLLKDENNFEEAFKYYDKCVEIVTHLAKRFVSITKMISWDIAIDEAGQPLLVESNMSGGGLDAHQICNGPLFGDMTEDVMKEVFANSYTLNSILKSIQ